MTDPRIHECTWCGLPGGRPDEGANTFTCPGCREHGPVYVLTDPRDGRLRIIHVEHA